MTPIVKKNVFLIAYILSVITYLIVRLFDYHAYALIVQPFMLLTLGGYYLVSTRKKNNFYLIALLSTIVGSLFFIFKYSTENFMIALIFIFVANMMFLLLIVHRMGIIRIKDILIRAAPIYVLLLALICTFFTVLLGIKVLIFMYSLSLALLLSFAFLYKKTSVQKGALLMLIGVILMVIRDFFTGLSKLLQQDNDYYLVLNVCCHALAMYLVCKSLLIDDNDTSVRQLN